MRYKPSKAKAKEFAIKMSEIENFCKENCIDASFSKDSYYFVINGQSYRVSNHTVDASNRKAFDDFGVQIRDIYHPDGELADVIYITASKTRIIEIYNALKSGKKLNKRGYVIE